MIFGWPAENLYKADEIRRHRYVFWKTDPGMDHRRQHRGGLAMKILIDFLTAIGAATVVTTIGLVIVVIIDRRRGK